jgi:hypothetical protein
VRLTVAQVQVTLPACFESILNSRVSKNELPVVEVCEPTTLTGAALSPADAATLAAAFRAIADPTRLRLLSLIGAHAGGEAMCVRPARRIRPVRADDQPPPQGAARGQPDHR